MKWKQSLAACGLLLLAGVSAASQALDYETLINQSGRQRMLAQRSVKAWLQQGQDIQSERAKRVLSESMQQADSQYQQLRNQLREGEFAPTLGRLGQEWQVLRLQLAGKPEAAAAQAIAAQADKVEAVADSLTRQLAEIANLPTANVINMAGRQRLLSQKLAKLYLLQRWSPNPVNMKQLLQTRDEFIRNLARIKQSPLTTGRIRNELDIAEGQWQLFDNALTSAADDSNPIVAQHVAVTSETLLASIDHIAKLYQHPPALQMKEADKPKIAAAPPG